MMAQRIRFLRDFDLRVKARTVVVIAYKAGMTMLVPDAHAKAAIAAGAAEAIGLIGDREISDARR